MKLELCPSRLIAASIGIVVVAVSGVSATPIPGFYASYSLGTDILTGRLTEAWNGGGPGLLGDTINVQSWDGVVLGTQWEISGAVSLGAVAQPGGTFNALTGNGTKLSRTTYVGGSFLMTSANGAPWGSGSGNLTSYSHDTTITYYNNQIIATRNNVNASGAFTSDPQYTLDFVVANAASVGMGPIKPANYPAFIGTPIVSTGAWSNVNDIVMHISVVPEPGSVIALGTGITGLFGVFLRRKR